MEGECFWVNQQRKIQGVWIPWCRNWIQDGRIQEGQIQDGHHHQVESEWMSEVFLFKWWGGKCEGSFFCANGWNQSCKYECVWEEKLRWLNPRWWNSRWQNSRWLPSSCWVRMNEFESDWISLSQSQSGGRVFLSESERRKQGVWIPQYRSWIQDGRIQEGQIQDDHHHQVESEVWVNEWSVWEEKLWWLIPSANGGNSNGLASMSVFERKN